MLLSHLRGDGEKEEDGKVNNGRSPAVERHVDQNNLLRNRNSIFKLISSKIKLPLKTSL
jgi:hypothetical protein